MHVREEIAVTDDQDPANREHLSLDRLVDKAIDAEMHTGARERTVARARRHLLVRLVVIVAGSVVTLLGLAMLVLPGPGLIAVALGLGLLASEVPFAARLLERVRERLPADEDGNLPTSAIVTMVVMALLATSASIWWAVR